MRLARLLFTVSSRGGSGTAVVDAPARLATIELQRGFVYALAPSPLRPRGEEVLRDLLKRADAAAEAQVRFDEQATPKLSGRVTPFHPAAVLRNHVEAALPQAAGRALRTRVGAGRVRLTLQPHPSCLGTDEKQLVSLLASAPSGWRTLAELDAARVAVPMRTDRLLAFLAATEAIALDADGHSPYRALGLDEAASLDEVKRAYKRLARTVHPDLRPDAPAEERRALEERFAAITEAYRALLGE